MSLRRFAWGMGVSATYVSQVETGKDPYGYALDFVMRAAVVLKLSASEAAEELSEFRAFYAAGLRRIDEFVVRLGKGETDA